MNVFEKNMFSSVPNEQLFKMFQQARDTGYRSPKLRLPDDPLLLLQQEPQQYYEVPPEQQAVQRANAQYANDRYGAQQLVKMGAEAATMLPQVVSGGLAGGAALTGAKLGGATWDEALGSYNEASDAAKQVVHNVLGNPSELMEAFDTYGFAPVNEYITKQSGDPRLGERLMDLLVMRGGLHGKQGKVAEFGQKAADTGLVTGAAAISPQLQDMSDDELGKLALAVGAVKTIGYHGGPEGITKLKPQEGGLGAVYVAPSRFEAKGYGIPFENEVPYKVGLNIQNPKYMPSEMVEGRPSSRGITPEIAEEYKSQGHDAVIGIDPKTGRPREYAVLNPDVTTILPSADKQAVQQWKNPVKSIKEQIFNLQKAIRETPDPVQKAELGRQIKELQQSKPAQPQAPKELPYTPVSESGGTFQSALLNAFGDPKFPQGKLNGPQLYKELKKRQVTDAEIESVYGNLQERGVIESLDAQDMARNQSVKLGEDVYGLAKQANPKERLNQEYMLASDEAIALGLPLNVEILNQRPYESLHPVNQRMVNAWNAMRELTEEMSAYATASKQPQFASYQAIKSQEGVVPGSYAEEFVTATVPPEKISFEEWQKLTSPMTRRLPIEEQLKVYNRLNELNYKSWLDEHGNYSDTKNPLVRIRYDIKEYPDGRKVMRLQELQDPKPVREARSTVEDVAKQLAKEELNAKWDDLNEANKTNLLEKAKEKVAARPVPHELATRAMDLGIKKAVARAKELGLDGIEWSTGEQQKDLYNNALRNIADEARWNPETKEFQLYKDGRRVTKGVPETLEQNQLKNWIGESGAQRLVESKLPKESRDWYESIDGWNLTGTDWAIEDLGRSKYKIYNKKTGYNELAYSEETAKRRAEKRANKDVTPFHTATDLSIDAKWPTKLYGDFKTIGKSNKPLDIDKMYDKVVNNNIDIGIAFKPEFSKLFKDNRNYEAAKKYRLEDDYDIMEEAQEFQSDLIQYIVENPNSDFAKRAMGENWQFDNMSVGSGDFDYSAQVPGLLKKYGKGEFGVSGEKMSAKELAELSDLEGQLSLSLKEIDRLDDLKAKLAGEIPQQPVMWFTKDTPSKFNIYEWAAITGLSVKMIEEYLNADDNKKQRMMKVMPVLGSIMTQRGNIRNTVGKTPSFIGREIAQPKALPSDAAIRAQEGIKNQILNSKLVPPGFPVRMTNIGELLNIAENSKLREGIAHEGNPGISAQVIPQGVKNPPIQSYGGNNLRSVAVIFPKDAVVNKGVNPNEVKINPSFDPNKARYLVSGYKRALTLTEVKSLIKKGLLTE